MDTAQKMINRRKSIEVAKVSRDTMRLLNTLQRVMKKRSFAPLLINQFKEEGLKVEMTGSFINPGTVLGFAYMSLVWLRETGCDVPQDLDDWMLSGMNSLRIPALSNTILQWENECKNVRPKTFAHYKYHLRNAISHGRVSWEDGVFRFEDALNDKTPVHTVISIPVKLLLELCDKVIECSQPK